MVGLLEASSHQDSGDIVLLEKLKRIARILNECVVSMVFSDLLVLLEYYLSKMAECSLPDRSYDRNEERVSLEDERFD